MKRRQFALAIATILLLLPLSSCQNTKIQVEQQVGIQEAIPLTYQEVQGKKTAEDDFVLYYYLDTCSGCQAFSPILNEYIQTKNVVIYKYPYSSGTSGLDTLFGPKTPEVVPALLFIQNGKISSTIFYSNKTASKFTESEAFAQYMETKIKLPSIAWVSREDLSAMIADNREFVVYFSLQGCGDCARLNQEFMNQYMSEYAGKAPLYIIEVYPWRQYKGNSDPVLAAQWIDFAEEFHLYFNYQDGTNQIPAVTIENYATYGDSGKIPTLQAWKDGALVDMVVYYNDRFSGTTWPRTISGSYYSDGPIGQTFATYAEYTSSATILEFYNNKIKTFLQQYLR